MQSLHGSLERRASLGSAIVMAFVICWWQRRLCLRKEDRWETGASANRRAEKHPSNLNQIMLAEGVARDLVKHSSSSLRVSPAW